MFRVHAETLQRNPFAQIASILLIAALLWTTGLPSWIQNANAAALFDFSDTLNDSDLSALSIHRLTFTTTAALDASDTMVITLDHSDDDFVINNLGASDFVATTSVSFVTACGSLPNEVTVATTTGTGANADTVTLTVCATDTISAGVISFQMGATSSPKITNPVASGSQIIRVLTTNDGGATRDSGDARVFIIDDVTVTASVDSTFSFTIAGVANGQTVNGASATTTATTTTAVLIPFETLTPGTSKILAQDLSVTTNAANGFRVTVFEDQNLTSSTGADIDLFSNGATTTPPIAWTTPTNVLNQEHTYGHFGITSQDGSLSNGDPFGTALWSGAFTAAAPLEVFYHNGPSDGTTDEEGDTRVGFQIEIESLQEAGNDYTNTLTYVATPVF